MRDQAAAYKKEIAGLCNDIENCQTTVRTKEVELQEAEAKRIAIAKELKRVEEREERSCKQLKLEHARVTQAIYVQLEEEKEARRTEVEALRSVMAELVAARRVQYEAKCQELQVAQMAH